ncbi:MAG: NAD(P)/FAD-dependent oxidoreductase [Clostridiaceae bacterium]
MSERFDIAIIGSGPAGASAAVNATIRNKNIIVFGYDNLSNKLVLAPRIDNYLGFFNITGKELSDKFKKHLDDMDINITTERINNIYAMGDYFTLMVNEKAYEARTIILATGMQSGKLIDGEDQYLGRGVGYCATCDAPLYRGKKVSIIGYNKEAEEEANYVSELASDVYYFPMYKGELNLNDSIKIINEKPKEIFGDSNVKGIKLKDRDEDIQCEGVFVLRDSISPGQLVPGLEVVENHIVVNRNMETNIKGAYAAGDCVGKPYQYLKAMGEGQVAALNAVTYLDSLKNNQ